MTEAPRTTRRIVLDFRTRSPPNQAKNTEKASRCVSTIVCEGKRIRSTIANNTFKQEMRCACVSLQVLDALPPSLNTTSSEMCFKFLLMSRTALLFEYLLLRRPGHLFKRCTVTFSVVSI